MGIILYLQGKQTLLTEDDPVWNQCGRKFSCVKQSSLFQIEKKIGNKWLPPKRDTYYPDLDNTFSLNRIFSIVEIPEKYVLLCVINMWPDMHVSNWDIICLINFVLSSRSW